MKIGIMTFWWDLDNYGQILQCYALQKYLRDAGHNAFLIRYDPRNDYIKTPLYKKIYKAINPVKLYLFLLSRLQKNKLRELNNKRNFEEFLHNYICITEKIYYSYSELKEDPPEADIYIVGSDQVWNISQFYPASKQAENIIRAYLLDFGSQSIKRIAYAASFGKDKLDDFSTVIFTNLLSNFNYISVREKSGIEICNKCSIKNAELVPDPTLLIDIGNYRSLYKDINIQSCKPYVLLYLVGNKLDSFIKYVYKWAKKNNIEIVYITANSQFNNKYKKTYATIPEWIYLTEHAEYVLTNSYHCSIFSIIFKKKFGILSLEENNNKDVNTRFDTLFQLFNIKQRFIYDNDFSILDKDINWHFVSEKLKNILNECNFLNIINK